MYAIRSYYDGLLQLRRHHQLLALTQLQARSDIHPRGARYAGRPITETDPMFRAAACVQPRPKAFDQGGPSAAARRSDLETFAQIDPADRLVLHDVLRRSRHQNLAVMQDVGPIDDSQSFPHIMVGYQDLV